MMAAARKTPIVSQENVIASQNRIASNNQIAIGGANVRLSVAYYAAQTSQYDVQKWERKHGICNKCGNHCYDVIAKGVRRKKEVIPRTVKVGDQIVVLNGLCVICNPLQNSTNLATVPESCSAPLTNLPEILLGQPSSAPTGQDDDVSTVTFEFEPDYHPSTASESFSGTSTVIHSNTTGSGSSQISPRPGLPHKDSQPEIILQSQAVSPSGFPQDSIYNIILTMKRNPSSVKIQTECCEDLIDAIRVNKGVVKPIVEAGGHYAIVKALQVHPTSNAVATDGCALLAEIAKQGHSGEASKAGGVQELVNAVYRACSSDTKSKEAATNACLAIRYLKGNPSAQLEACSKNAVKAVTAAVKAFPESSVVQQVAFGALASLLDFSWALRQELPRPRPPPVVRKNDVSPVARSIGVLSGVAAAGAAFFFETVAVIDGCAGEGVQEATSRFLRFMPLASKKLVVAKTSVQLEQLAQLVPSSMRTFSCSSSVQENGCWAMGALSSLDISLATNGVHEVVTAMHQQRHSLEVQENGCRALLRMAEAGMNEAMMQSAGVPSAVRFAANYYPALPAVQAIRLSRSFSGWL